MKGLKNFASFLRENRIKEYTVYYLTSLREMDIPIIKLAIEKGLVKDVLEENSVKMTVESQGKFLQSIEEGTTISNAKVSMKMWEEDKLPGISKHEILPSDLILLYAAQKKAIFHFLPDYTKDADEIVIIIQELEDLYTQLQNEASQLLFKIQKETQIQLKQAKEYSKLIIQGIKDYGIFMLDTEGRVLSWNRGAENIKGYKAEEIIGKNISVFYIEEEKNIDRPKHDLEMALKYGRYETEGWHIRKDKSVFWADVVYNPMFDENGKHYGYTEVARDLTSRKKYEEEIKKSNDFLDSVLENIPNMVFVKDANDLRFLRFNKAGEQLLGISQKDLLGKNDYDFFSSEQADRFTSKDKAVLKGDVVVDIPEEEIQTKHGERWLHTRKIPIKNVAGKPLYLLGISEDITVKKKVDEKIKKLNDELTESVVQLELANKELESFSYSVSHDLRAPLRAIRGYTKILMEDYAPALEDDAKKIMTGVASNAERMSHLIDDLLQFSRMGKKEMNLALVNMNEVVDFSLNEAKAAYGSNVKIKINELPSVMADYSLMCNVFSNLISNAIKYSGKVPKPVIEISGSKKSSEVIYCVKDNGVGFDMKYYDKLFGIFQRLHTTKEFEGTGVGLALVKRIVSRHGGRVWAEAEPDKGATFFIALNSNNQ